jgi:hypothetical protein
VWRPSRSYHGNRPLPDLADADRRTATGLGVWCAGSAGRMPQLAPVVPDWTDCITVLGRGDVASKRHAMELADALTARGFETFLEGGA